MSQSPLISRISQPARLLETHPPATNRGVETPTQERIDWISFTLPIASERVWPDGFDTVRTTTKSFNGYDTAEEYADGRIQLTSSTRPEMGIHCVLSGSTCGTLQAELPSILENCWLQGGKVTRFDLALDDLTGRIDPAVATEHIKAGKVQCRAREYPIYHDAAIDGYTQYFGKMSSEVHVCLYEKSKEQKVYGFTVRCEIRFKGRKADKAVKTYLQSKDCRGLILGYVKFPEWAEWNEVFSTKPIRVNSTPQRSRRVLWLLGQVSKSIALEISERGGDLEILTLIRESVMMKLSDIRQAGDDQIT